MERIGVGVIGCGDIARVRYFPSIAALPELRLVGVCSRTRSACEPIVQQYGGRIYEDAEALLGDPKVDAVVIATSHASHAEISIKALTAGKHVLTEKPMATSLADADRLCRAARQARGIFMALPLDSCPPIDEAKRLIGGGAIGRVNGADAVLAHHGPAHASWFFDGAEAGWGVLADLGIYLISQLVYLFGPAASVTGRVTTIFPERIALDGRAFRVSVEDNAAAVLNWSDNVLGTVRANWCSPADRRKFIWETRIYGSEGIIFMNMAHPEAALIVYSPRRVIKGSSPVVRDGMTECYQVHLPNWDIHKDVLAKFAEKIMTGRSTGDGIIHEHHVIEVINKIYESSKSGTSQVLGS